MYVVTETRKGIGMVLNVLNVGMSCILCYWIKIMAFEMKKKIFWAWFRKTKN